MLRLDADDADDAFSGGGVHAKTKQGGGQVKERPDSHTAVCISGNVDDADDGDNVNTMTMTTTEPGSAEEPG